MFGFVKGGKMLLQQYLRYLFGLIFLRVVTQKQVFAEAILWLMITIQLLLVDKPLHTYVSKQFLSHCDKVSLHTQFYDQLYCAYVLEYETKTIFVTGFDKSRLGCIHRADSFLPPINRSIHKLIIDGYFTVHSSSVCFPRGLSCGLSGTHECTGALQMALVLADKQLTC